MTNTELLIHLGFVKRSIKDCGEWYCNPCLQGKDGPEEVFQVGTFENKPIKHILELITGSAINYGARQETTEAKEIFKEELEGEVKKLIKTLSKLPNGILSRV